MINVDDFVALRYQVESELGAGGMGTVYLAADMKLRTRVAIKCPHPSLMQDAEFASRFQNEVKSLVALSHPHIVKIHDVDSINGLPFIVMQFLGGGSLEDVVEHEYASSSPKDHLNHLRRWLPDMAAALDFMHSKGFIHRDVKPGNIMFDTDGHPYLGDFSIAKVTFAAQKDSSSSGLTRTGTVMGTPEYMAPELAMGEKYDHSVDQYALAVTVFETLAGKPPYTGSTPAAVLLNQSTQKIPRLHRQVNWLQPETSDVTMRALAKDGRERFASCREFADAFLATLPYEFEENAPSNATAAKIDGVTRLQCPECRRTVGLSRTHSGKRIKCPSCFTRLRVGKMLDSLRVLDSSGESASGNTVSVAAVTTSHFATESETPNILKESHERAHQSSLKTRLPWLITGAAIVALATIFRMSFTPQPTNDDWLEQPIVKVLDTTSRNLIDGSIHDTRKSTGTTNSPAIVATEEKIDVRPHATADVEYHLQNVDELKARLRKQPISAVFSAELRNQLLQALDSVHLNAESDQGFTSLIQQFLDKTVTNSMFVANVDLHMHRLLPMPDTPLHEDVPVRSNNSGMPRSSLPKTAVVASLGSSSEKLKPKSVVQEINSSEDRCRNLVARRKVLAEEKRVLSDARQGLNQELTQVTQQLKLIQTQGTALTRELARIEGLASDLQIAQNKSTDLNERTTLQRSIESLAAQYNTGKITIARLQRESVSQANAARKAKIDLSSHMNEEGTVDQKISEIEAQWLQIVEPAGPLESGNHKFVIEQSTAWLAHDPTFTEALQLRAMSFCFGAGKFGESLRDIELLLQQTPNSSELVAFQAFVIGKTGNTPKARSLFGRARRLQNPTTLVYSLDARTRWNSKDYRRANADFKKALSRDSQHLLTQIWFAELLATCPEDNLRDGAKALKLAIAACNATMEIGVQNGPTSGR